MRAGGEHSVGGAAAPHWEEADPASGRRRGQASVDMTGQVVGEQEEERQHQGEQPDVPAVVITLRQ